MDANGTRSLRVERTIKVIASGAWHADNGEGDDESTMDFCSNLEFSPLSVYYTKFPNLFQRK